MSETGASSSLVDQDGAHVAAGTYRFFDHTGDFGVDLEAEDPGAILATFAEATLELMTDAAAAVSEVEEREIELEGMDAADVLVALGNELLYLFEAEGFLCRRFEPEEVHGDYVFGVAHGEPFDPARHPIARPIKAVTHHGAEVRENEDGRFQARIVFDL